MIHLMGIFLDFVFEHKSHEWGGWSEGSKQNLCHFARKKEDAEKI